MLTKKSPIIFTFLCLSLFNAHAAEVSSYQIIENKATLPILTPALEERRVEKLILANGLKVYLISDPGADQSAAGLSVETGSWDDPKEYPGMAHFLEHMLFMGTVAYPKEDEYMQFISDRGGKLNAYTSPDKTVYMFSVNSDSFEASLDRFSHFFYDPLLLQDCISRELHAVDQEHAKNIEHDGWRQYMIFKSTSNPNHPNALFSTGNASTLSDIPHEALKQWYEAHYSADRMHLTMLSPLPLARIRTLAVDAFSRVRSFSQPAKKLPETFTSAQQRGHMFFIKPVKELKQLSLSWEVPRDFAYDIEKNAPELITYALNRETEGTLTHRLKKEQIAEGVSASCDRFSKDTLVFSIDIALTDKGITQIDKAIAYVFEALARIKEEGYPRHLFDEAQAMATLNYQYQSRDDAFTTIMAIAGAMPYEELSTFPQKTSIPTTFDPAFISRFLSTLTPDSCFYSVLADPEKTGIAPNRTEKWMQAEYAVKKLSPSFLTTWSNLKSNPAIALPAANPYLPTSTALISNFQKQSDTRPPLLICSDEGAKIYHASDTRYKVPEIAFRYAFKSPSIDDSVQSQVLLDLYIRALEENLSATLSNASAAGLSAQFSSDGLSLNLRVNGYSDKAPLLMQTLFKAMQNVGCSKEEFRIYATSLAEYYNNASKELPVIQAMQQLSGLLMNMPTKEEKASAIRSISYDAFMQFNSILFSSAYLEGMLYGNLNEEEARSLNLSLSALFPTSAYPVEKHTKEKFLLLSSTQRPRKIHQTTERQGHGVLLLLQEGAYSFERRGIQQILGTALQDAFHDTLRTKQQTAYYVKAWNTEQQRQLLQYFAVQSSTHSPADLLARFELFLEDFDKNLSSNITKERFESLKENLTTLLSMPPENMYLMANQLELFAFEYEDFDWLDKRIASVKELTYERFCEVAHTFLSRSNARRLAMLIEGVLTPENDFRYDPISKEEVLKSGTFVSIK